MPDHPSFGPSRTACNRCRLHKRRCNRTYPSCSLCSRLGQAELCIYEEADAYPPPASDEGARDPPIYEALTLLDIKKHIVTRLSDTNPRKIVNMYSKTIHPWFSIFSPAFCDQCPATWDAASVDFALLCFAIVLLNSAPQQLGGVYTLHSTHRSMYLMGKTWIALLEAAGQNSIHFVKARLLVTLFEVSQGFDIAAYLSIASVVRAADALVVFDQRGVSQSLAEQEVEEYMIMWWGIAILDRYIATENGNWPPVTRGRQVPPDCAIANSPNPPEHSATVCSRLFEASILLDNIHTALHQPTTQMSFNIEELTIIVRTLTSLETVVTQEIPKGSKVFSGCLTLSSTALFLAFENGSKAISQAAAIACVAQATAALDNLIDDIVERVAVLSSNNLVPEEAPVPLFVTFLVYKAAAITTGRLQNGLEPETNLQRLRALRNALKSITRRWLAGQRFLELLDEDTSPRIFKALRDKSECPTSI